MSDPDCSCVLGPITPTYMPYFPPHRSPLHSSNNTRQRDDYELNSQFCPSSPSPQVFVTIEEDEDYETPPTNPERTIEGYPASELPFASEPALEGELEQGLPPLKKLKPDSDFDTPGERFDKNSAQGIVLIGAIKGILTRRVSTSGDLSSLPQSPPTSSPVAPDACYIPWSRALGEGTNNLSALIPSSTPLSRRSSSGASSVCTGSLKAVRFASGNFTDARSGSQQSQPILPGEVEGPVAAVLYLTHSAEAYDRSPIIVEDGLRLPPRARPDDDADEPPLRFDNKRRAKLNIQMLKAGRDQICRSPQVLSPKSPQQNGMKENCEDTSLIVKSPIVIHKSYREVEEVDEEEEETVGPDSSINEGQHVDEDDDDDQGVDHPVEEEVSDDDEDDDHLNSRSRAANTERWGLGKWSSGEVFGCCDALGGF